MRLVANLKFYSLVYIDPKKSMKGEGNIDNLEGDKRIEKIEISSLPKKWNAVVSNIEDKIDDVPAPPPPSAQPNKRERVIICIIIV